MEIASVQQRSERIIQVAERFEMEKSLEDILIARRLRWLGSITIILLVHLHGLSGVYQTKFIWYRERISLKDVPCT